MSELDSISRLASLNSATYETLPSPYAIRLLELHAGTDELLSCRLIIVPDLKDAPQYHALSYRWVLDDVQEIVCSGSLFCITRDLYDLLYKLRLPVRSRLLWADAICINQDDVAERTKQVLLMRQIFSQAEKVHVWLGRSTDNDKLSVAADTIRYIADRLCTAQMGAAPRAAWLSKLRQEQDLNWIADASILEGTTAGYWPKLEALYTCAWFSRIWVVQEVQSCDDSWLHCGDEAIEWPWVALVARWMTLDRAKTTLIPSSHYKTWYGQSNPQAEFMVDKVIKSPLTVPLLWVLHLSRCFRSSDPRDMVFAMLKHPTISWPQDHIELDVAPDYATTAAEIYHKIAVESIEKSRRLDILSYTWRPQPATNVGRDWVPQWNVPCYTTTNPLPTWMYDATKDWPADVLASENNLVLRGITIGAVRTMSEVLAVKSDDGSNMPSIPIIQVDTISSLARIVVHDRWLEGRNPNMPPETCGAVERTRLQIVNLAAAIAKVLRSTCDTIDDPRFFAATTINCDGCGKVLVSANIAYSSVPKVWKPHADEATGQEDWCTACLAALSGYDQESGEVELVPAIGIWMAQDMLADIDSPKGPPDGAARQFQNLFRLAGRSRSWMLTDTGLVGSSVFGTLPGDIVVVFLGASVPFVLRPMGSCFKLIGDCYVDGMMDGQAIDMWKRKELKLDTFKLM